MLHISGELNRLDMNQPEAITHKKSLGVTCAVVHASHKRTQPARYKSTRGNNSATCVRRITNGKLLIIGEKNRGPMQCSEKDGGLVDFDTVETGEKRKP